MNIEKETRMKEDDKWVENLRNKLEDYSEPLPDALWERLEEELSAPRVIPMWRTRRFVAAAVLVVAVSSLTFWFINSPTADYMRSNEALVEELDFSSTPDDEVLSSSEKIFSSDNSKMDSSDPVVASSPAKVCLAKIETPENHNQEVVAESEIMSIKEEYKVEDKEQETGSTNYDTDKNGRIVLWKQTVVKLSETKKCWLWGKVKRTVSGRLVCLQEILLILHLAHLEV